MAQLLYEGVAQWNIISGGDPTKVNTTLVQEIQKQIKKGSQRFTLRKLLDVRRKAGEGSALANLPSAEDIEKQFREYRFDSEAGPTLLTHPDTQDGPWKMSFIKTHSVS
jgi:hypothetical protein